MAASIWKELQLRQVLSISLEKTVCVFIPRLTINQFISNKFVKYLSASGYVWFYDNSSLLDGGGMEGHISALYINEDGICTYSERYPDDYALDDKQGYGFIVVDKKGFHTVSALPKNL